MSVALLASLAVASFSVQADTLFVAANNAPVWGAKLELREELRIGALTGADHEVFGRIKGVVANPDGTIVIADSQVPILQRFASDGTYLGSIGGKGEGPGEYRSITGISPLSEGRFAIQDARRGRALIYASNGSFEREFVLMAMDMTTGQSFATDQADHMYIRAVGCGNDPRCVQSPDWPQMWIHHSPTGEVIDTLHLGKRNPEKPRYAWITGEGRRFPFTIDSQWAIGSLGQVISGRANAYALHWTRADGQVVQVSREYVPVRIRGAERRQWQAMNAEIQGISRDSKFGPIPRFKPVFRSLRTDAEGRIWVERYVEAFHYEYSADEIAELNGRTPREWRELQTFDVFGPDGTFLGTVQLPPATQFTFARGDLVWGIQRGEFDEQYVVRFRIESAN